MTYSITSPQCVCLSSSSSYEDTSCTVLGPRLPSPELITYTLALSPNSITFRATRGDNFSISPRGHRSTCNRLIGKEPACQCRRHQRLEFNSWVGKFPWRRAWQPTPVFMPGESHGQRSLAGYGPWGSQHVRHNWATEHAHDTEKHSVTQSVASQITNQCPQHHVSSLFYGFSSLAHCKPRCSPTLWRQIPRLPPFLLQRNPLAKVKVGDSAFNWAWKEA